MKLGTENRNKTLIAAGLLVAALLLFARMLSTPSTTATVPPSPPQTDGLAASQPNLNTSNPNSPARRNADTGRHEKTLTAVLKPSLDPRLRLDMLRSSEDVEYKGAGRDIFSGEPEAIPQPIAPARQDINPQPVVNQGPPPPPPINLKFFGYATRTGTRKSIFLAQGDTVFTAREGDIVAGRYRVVKINPTSVEIQDVLSNNTQTIPLIQG